MEPPTCDVCDQRFDPDSGQRVRFVQTDAGDRFDTRALEPGFVGDHPDEGWFCRDHTRPAAALASTHTRSAAVAQLATDRTPTEPDRRTPTRHELGQAAPLADIIDAFRTALTTALTRLGLDTIEPTTEQTQSTSPGPEWREAATTTELVTTETWSDPTVRVVYGYRDIRWDSWSGTPRAGDLLQGVVSLKIDDHWLFAAFGPDATVTRIDESGPRHPDTIDALIARFTR